MSEARSTGTLPHAESTPPNMKKIAVASVIGTTVEWYDLFVFATASALVFNKVFFPSFVPLIGTLLAFGTFASAYLARIVGAALFGHFGDRLGRKSMLLVSLITMGIATFAIGLLPNYSSIGMWAPVLLLALRVIQGLALGGEWGGAVLMAVEHAPPSKRGLYGSWVQVGVPAGTLIANLAFLISNAVMSSEALLSWGWRIPFLASALLVGVGLYIRLNTSETPSFSKVKEAAAQVKVPLVEVLTKNWKQVLLGGIATMSTGTSFNLIVAFGLTYGTQTLGFTRNAMLAIALISCAVCIVLLPAFGRLSDVVGRKPVIVGGILAEALLAFPLFWLLDMREFPFALIGYLLMMTAFAANYGPIATFLAELFGTQVRYSGLSISYMLSGLLGSAATPIITAALLSATGKGSSVAWYMIGSAALSVVALLLLAETLKRDLSAKAYAPKAEVGLS
ncbi:major facilitator transporter [Caballeronia arationis]|jgi:metabolite-proton symporter|uniref:Metabolite-proton symporter n=1 Tax=Caballeronia arationis TaxID=1777142 RepID=A0A7Z7N164_9BURK|nr:MFS transporter [Caballeronia arationis]SAL07388.1 major facilitator transporter [Caballeronia arationis]SOE53374.1 metabolite-proton symporter [Caballeronia arationis]